MQLRLCFLKLALCGIIFLLCFLIDDSCRRQLTLYCGQIFVLLGKIGKQVVNLRYRRRFFAPSVVLDMLQPFEDRGKIPLAEEQTAAHRKEKQKGDHQNKLHNAVDNRRTIIALRNHNRQSKRLVVRRQGNFLNYTDKRLTAAGNFGKLSRYTGNLYVSGKRLHIVILTAAGKTCWNVCIILARQEHTGQALLCGRLCVVGREVIGTDFVTANTVKGAVTAHDRHCQKYHFIRCACKGKTVSQHVGLIHRQLGIGYHFIIVREQIGAKFQPPFAVRHNII